MKKKTKKKGSMRSEKDSRQQDGRKEYGGREGEGGRLTRERKRGRRVAAGDSASPERSFLWGGNKV